MEPSLNNPRSVFVQGDYAYVASASSHSLQIVNISDPANHHHMQERYTEVVQMEQQHQHLVQMELEPHLVGQPQSLYEEIMHILLQEIQMHST